MSDAEGFESDSNIVLNTEEICLCLCKDCVSVYACADDNLVIGLCV